jgi:hypothetical protein
MYIIQLRNLPNISVWNRWNHSTELKFDRKKLEYNEDYEEDREIAIRQETTLDDYDHTTLKEL